jgi:RNA ligase (TIGR02306 family)
LHNVRKHPNADRIQLATVCGEQVVVGLDAKEGDLGVYFATDGQLSTEFAYANDLVARKDENGNRAGGFFSAKRQVRAQNFRGERSQGFWMPVSCLEFTGAKPAALQGLSEGYEFDVFNGVAICQKYVSPATRTSTRRSERANSHFPKHVDTDHLNRNGHKITAGSVVYVTEKLHGTSQRIGYVPEDIPLPRTFLDWLLGRTRTKSEFRYLLGTRNTILADRDQIGFYGSEEFRWLATRSLVGQLHKDEIIYGEVVGYVDVARPIMAQQSTKELPEVRERFGDLVTYSYGCEPGQCKFYVYRIVRGGVELSWPQVKGRCHELGIDHVPELGVYIADDGEARFTGHEWYHSTLDNRHPFEGVVYRIENEHGTTFLKDKTFTFGVLEGYLKTSDDYVDLEEVS